MWVMGEWAVGHWIVSVTSFRKMYGYMGLRSIGSDQLDRFRTQRYNHKKKKKKKKKEDFASSRSVPFGSDKHAIQDATRTSAVATISSSLFNITHSES